MAELTLTRIKRIQLLLFAVVIIMLFFGGCGGQESDGGVRLEDMAVSLAGGVDINAMGTEEWKGSQDSDGANGDSNLNGAGNADAAEIRDGSGNVTEPKMALNPNTVTVTYQGMDYISYCRTMGGDSI